MLYTSIDLGLDTGAVDAGTHFIYNALDIDLSFLFTGRDLINQIIIYLRFQIFQRKVI